MVVWGWDVSSLALPAFLASATSTLSLQDDMLSIAAPVLQLYLRNGRHLSVLSTTLCRQNNHFPTVQVSWEGNFLFQRISVLIQLFNAPLWFMLNAWLCASYKSSSSSSSSYYYYQCYSSCYTTTLTAGFFQGVHFLPQKSWRTDTQLHRRGQRKTVKQYLLQSFYLGRVKLFSDARSVSRSKALNAEMFLVVVLHLSSKYCGRTTKLYKACVKYNVILGVKLNRKVDYCNWSVKAIIATGNMLTSSDRCIAANVAANREALTWIVE